tara:strand:+ start:39 stop:506 length:468 start_codon:yes stop_codon:yes gene_type:complete
MNSLSSRIEINIYYIKSKFDLLALNLCKLLTKKKLKTLINLKDSKEKEELDSYLWTFEKNSFLPHKIIEEDVFDLDNILLFHGDYGKLEKYKSFRNLIISPNVKIKKFMIFEKFLIFSNFEMIKNLKIERQKLEKISNKVSFFQEHEELKWRVIN